MRRCWLLVITKGVRVWMPPEVYLESALALREVRRWISVLSRTRSSPTAALEGLIRLPRNAALHLAEMEFPESWRASPLWVCLRWSSAPDATLQTAIMSLDSDEARVWVKQRSRADVDPGADPELRFESSWERAGVVHHAAAHRLKRIIGS
jgi:hypothetical protein